MVKSAIADPLVKLTEYSSPLCFTVTFPVAFSPITLIKTVPFL